MEFSINEIMRELKEDIEDIIFDILCISRKTSLEELNNAHEILSMNMQKLILNYDEEIILYALHNFELDKEVFKTKYLDENGKSKNTYANLGKTIELFKIYYESEKNDMFAISKLEQKYLDVKTLKLSEIMNISKALGVHLTDDEVAEHLNALKTYSNKKINVYTNIKGERYALGFIKSDDDIRIVNYLDIHKHRYTTIAFIWENGRLSIFNTDIPEMAKAEIKNRPEIIIKNENLIEYLNNFG